MPQGLKRKFLAPGSGLTRVAFREGFSDEIRPDDKEVPLERFDLYTIGNPDQVTKTLDQIPTTKKVKLEPDTLGILKTSQELIALSPADFATAVSQMSPYNPLPPTLKFEKSQRYPLKEEKKQRPPKPLEHKRMEMFTQLKAAFQNRTLVPSGDATPARVLSKILSKPVHRVDSKDVNTAEAIVLTQGRPVYRIQDSEVVLTGQSDPQWDQLLKDNKEQIKKNCKSVGRIEFTDGRMIATGFVVGKNLVLTNRHVAEAFCDIQSRRILRPALINFRAEVDPEEPHLYKVKLTELLEVGVQALDYSLFRTESSPYFPPPLPLATRIALDSKVYLIGYPAYDPDRNDRSVQIRIFGGVFNVKRLSPGVLFAKTTTQYTSDYSSLGGSSGSPLFDFKTGSVVGLHYQGVYLVANDAVPMAKIHSAILQHTLPEEVPPS